MNLTLNKTVLSYFILCFLFLSGLGIALGGLFIPFVFVVEGAFLGILLFNKKVLMDIIQLIRKTPFLYFVLFLVWATITVIISVIRGSFYTNSFFFSYVGGLIFSVTAPIVISYLVNKKALSTNLFIKLYLFIYVIIFSVGLAEMALRFINTDIANLFISIFNNKRIALAGLNASDLTINSMRIRSIFEEPSAFGGFIYLNVPIIYSLCTSKYNIFKNKTLNKLIKIGLPILTFLNLIFTKSPMTLIFVLIITFFYFYKSLFKVIVKKPLLSLSVFFGAILITLLGCFIDAEIYNVDLRTSYIQRIFSTIPALYSLNALIDAEPSLATRVINYLNSLQVFAQHPVLGIGYGNMSRYMVIQIQNSTLPMTYELWLNLELGTGTVASAIFYRVLAETGLIGFIFLYTFMFKTFLLNKKLLTLATGLEKDFLKGINAYLIVFMTFVCFYGSNLHTTYYWLFFGFVFAYKFKMKNGKRGS
ncbi:MAG: hypothetical protein K6C94_03100 [Candidatus Gastranaerophilales bacterium]|nr:hypothetical protein [Candidatus Gastranaerophilales bacterium]